MLNGVASHEFDPVGAASLIPDHPNVWTDGSLVLDQGSLVCLLLKLGSLLAGLRTAGVVARWGHVDHVRPEGEVQSCRGFCSVPGPLQSVQRAEMWSVILALQSSGAAHLGVDNLGVVRHVGRLLDGHHGSAPFELVKDGDLLLLIEPAGGRAEACRFSCAPTRLSQCPRSRCHPALCARPLPPRRWWNSWWKCLPTWWFLMETDTEDEEEEEEERLTWIDDNDDAWALIRPPGRRPFWQNLLRGYSQWHPAGLRLARAGYKYWPPWWRNAWFDSGYILCVSFRRLHGRIFHYFYLNG